HRQMMSRKHIVGVIVCLWNVSSDNLSYMEYLMYLNPTDVSLPSTRRLNYGPFGYFEVRCAAGFGCCAALWSSCHFGCSGARDGPYPTPLCFAASIHLVLLHGSCHHFLVCRNRAGPARSLTLLFGNELFLDS